jgi:hypothetical protein
VGHHKRFTPATIIEAENATDQSKIKSVVHVAGGKLCAAGSERSREAE